MSKSATASLLFDFCFSLLGVAFFFPSSFVIKSYTLLLVCCSFIFAKQIFTARKPQGKKFLVISVGVVSLYFANAEI